MSVILCNAFSLNMLPGTCPANVQIVPVKNPAEFLNRHVVRNCIGHADTDAVVRHRLHMDGCDIPAGKRESVQVGQGDVLCVAQYCGPRLAEGATELPEGASIQWFQVTVDYRPALQR